MAELDDEFAKLVEELAPKSWELTIERATYWVSNEEHNRLTDRLNDVVAGLRAPGWTWVREMNGAVTLVLLNGSTQASSVATGDD